MCTSLHEGSVPVPQNFCLCPRDSWACFRMSTQRNCESGTMSYSATSLLSNVYLRREWHAPRAPTSNSWLHLNHRRQNKKEAALPSYLLHKSCDWQAHLGDDLAHLVQVRYILHADFLVNCKRSAFLDVRDLQHPATFRCSWFYSTIAILFIAAVSGHHGARTLVPATLCLNASVNVPNKKKTRYETAIQSRNVELVVPFDMYVAWPASIWQK